MFAHHIRVILEDHGIEATVLGEPLSVEAPLLPIINMMPAVWVKDVDVHRALAILREGETSGTGQAEDWMCANCSESVEPQFCVCWSCETPRPNVDRA